MYSATKPFMVIYVFYIYFLITETGALTEENLVFLEAWRTLDRAYIDKSFNGQNWFKYRQDALKNFSMKNRQETCVCYFLQNCSVNGSFSLISITLFSDEAIKRMIATLDDPFTRFLEPDKLKSLKVRISSNLASYIQYFIGQHFPVWNQWRGDRCRLGISLFRSRWRRDCGGFSSDRWPSSQSWSSAWRCDLSH